MSFYEKLMIALGILALGTSGALLPILLFRRKEMPAGIIVADYFARGIFLGAGLLHLLPDATLHWPASSHAFPWAYLICALMLAVLIFSEDILETYFTLDLKDRFYLVLLGAMLSLHAFLAGLALGITQYFESFMVLLIAILAHKGIEAFALGLRMQWYRSQYQRMPWYLFFIFILSTPLGISLGALLTQNSPYFSLESAYLNSIFEAIAAGTFIYLAAFNELKLTSASASRFLSLTKPMAFLVGLAGMSSLAYYH